MIKEEYYNEILNLLEEIHQNNEKAIVNIIFLDSFFDNNVYFKDSCNNEYAFIDCNSLYFSTKEYKYTGHSISLYELRHNIMMEIIKNNYTLSVSTEILSDDNVLYKVVINEGVLISKHSELLIALLEVYRAILIK
jgi:hypothetical protein